MARESVLVGAALLLVQAGLAAGQVQEFKLTPQEPKGAVRALETMLSGYSGSEARRPAEVKAVPADLKGRQWYCRLDIGGREVWILLDAAGSKSRLFVDTNGDGDLSNEEPLPVHLASKTDPAAQHSFGPVSLPAEGGGKHDIRIMLEPTGPEAYFSAAPATLPSGRIELDGASYAVVLLDRQLDGRFDKTFSADAGMNSDWLAIDLNGNGTFERTAYVSPELLPLPKLIQLKQKWYSLEVAPDGSSIRVQSVTPPMGTLQVAAPDVELQLVSDSGYHELKAAGNPWQLPAGAYAAMRISLSRKDEKGVVWGLSGSSSTGKLQKFTLQEGQVTSLAAGPPLRVKVQALQQGDLVSLGCSVLGQAGETYGAGATRAGVTQPAPKLRIVGEDGTVLASGKFEYG
jgi:hypothetical protein